ncbi:hypothetical protein POM88_015363 [Heracleum sosnowskyi]|uniref:Uncharacterized protein n=1 Tax=Heracleum sosnowskyi TaxID=360622 RepID=A0AAD8IK21_9APIA|nr:hypothetical protein POM88_015363 [Heracleum sosnowskyi]
MKSKYQSEDRMDTYVFGHTEGSNSSNKNDVPNVFNEELRDHPDMHEKLKDVAALPLWPGCTKFSKLSVVLTLYNLKVGHQVSDVFFTEMLLAVSELLPDGNVLPRRTYEAKQMLKSIGLVHNRIHACPNDCILYQKEIKDGMLRHPADSPQWKTFDDTHKDFGKEPRNLRLALSTDGMNPHGQQSSSHSTWPVTAPNPGSGI